MAPKTKQQGQVKPQASMRRGLSAKEMFWVFSKCPFDGKSGRPDLYLVLIPPSCALQWSSAAFSLSISCLDTW